MDIERPTSARNRRRRRKYLYAAGGLIILVGITVGLSRLDPAPPSIDRATVWIDTVKRGQMLRSVRGPGTLVPREVRWIPAVTQGRVERILVLPGTRVDDSTVLIELSNPELEQTARDAEWQWKAASADYRNLEVQLDSQLFNQQAAVAQAEAEFKEASLRYEKNEILAREGLVSELDLKLSEARAESTDTRFKMEKKRLEIAAQAVVPQLEAQRARMEQLRELHELRRNQVEALRVRPGNSGVLQRVPVEVGQQVSPGANLAQVAEPRRLKAELRISATQARDIQLGQAAEIDTRNGIIPGRVTRIDPAVQEGTVTVDVALEGELPKGARPDLAVDGTIEIERLEDVLFVGRPAYGREESRVGLFRLAAGGRMATRIQVQLGRSSVSIIEIREGLKEGDQVILSDMSTWDSHDRIRLH